VYDVFCFVFDIVSNSGIELQIRCIE